MEDRRSKIEDRGAKIEDRGSKMTPVMVSASNHDQGRGRSASHARCGTRHAARGTRHEARSTKHAARGTRHEARGTRHEARAGLSSAYGRKKGWAFDGRRQFF